MFKQKKIRTNLRKILDDSRSKLTDQNIEFITELIDAGEWGLALEVTCEQLYEYDMKVDPDLYELMDSTGKLMKMDSSKWDFLDPSK